MAVDKSTETAFAKAIREKREQEQARDKAAEIVATHIPQSVYDQSPEQAELQRLLDDVGIVKAYELWAGKGKAVARRGQTEGVKIRCPKPSHPDNEASAWANTLIDTWFCGGCWEGGDKYDIAAYHFGYGVPDYKGSQFPDLKDKMAESLGFSVSRGPDGKSSAINVAEIVEANRERALQQSERTQQSSELAHGTNGNAVPDSGNGSEQPNGSADAHSESPPEAIDTFSDLNFPTLEWRSIAKPGSFLDFYMHACIVDDAAEEFHFWNAMLALGMAVGRNVTLADQTPVLANLFICVVGRTGDRKSRAFGHLRRLLKDAIPYDASDPNSTGAFLVPTSASGEQLISSFSQPIPDPVTPSRIAGYGAVRGLVRYDEFSSLTQRANRQGSTIRETLMEFYDGNEQITTASRTGGTQIAENAFCSFFTTTQPDSVKKLIKDTDVNSGFINRWLFISGRSKKKVHVGGSSPDLTYASKELKHVHQWSSMLPIQITWSQAAEKHFSAYAETVLEKLQDEPLLGRLDLLAKKLILLIAINEQAREITIEHVTKMISMHNYIVAAYAIPRARIGTHVSNEIHDEVLRHIERMTHGNYPEGVTLNDLKRVMKRNNFPDDILRRTMKAMIEFGEIIVVKPDGKKKGRPSVKYLLGGE